MILQIYNLYLHRHRIEQFSHLLCNHTYVSLNQGVGNECHKGLKLSKSLMLLKLVPKLGQDVTILFH